MVLLVTIRAVRQSGKAQQSDSSVGASALVSPRTCTGLVGAVTWTSGCPDCARSHSPFERGGVPCGQLLEKGVVGLGRRGQVLQLAKVLCRTSREPLTSTKGSSTRTHQLISDGSTDAEPLNQVLATRCMDRCRKSLGRQVAASNDVRRQLFPLPAAGTRRGVAQPGKAPRADHWLVLVLVVALRALLDQRRTRQERRQPEHVHPSWTHRGGLMLTQGKARASCRWRRKLIR